MARPKKGYMDEEEGSTTGRWTTEEHALFEDGLRKYGKQWKRIAEEIPSRTVVQIRTHAQKYFLKLAKIEPATSTSIALKPPTNHNQFYPHVHAHNHGLHSNAAFTSLTGYPSNGNGNVGPDMELSGQGSSMDLPLSLTRKKRSVGKSTYRRLVPGLDGDEMEEEIGCFEADKLEKEGDGINEEDEGCPFRSSTLTSRGRVSRPPRNKSTFPSHPSSPAGIGMRGEGFGSGIDTSHTTLEGIPQNGASARAVGTALRKQQKQRARRTAPLEQNGLRGSGSVFSSASSLTHSIWGALHTSSTDPTPSSLQSLPPRGLMNAEDSGCRSGAGVGPAGGLMVRIPMGEEHALDMEDNLFAAGELNGLFESLREGALVGAPTQTPTSVMHLYPDMDDFPDAMGAHVHGPEEDGKGEGKRERVGGANEALPGSDRPDYMLGVPGSLQSTGCCGSSTTSASSGVAGTTEGEEEEEEEALGEGEDAFSHLHELAGRGAPDWADAFEEALGALEGAEGVGEEGALGLHALQQSERLEPMGREASSNSLTDSSNTDTYLPSDESDGEQAGARPHLGSHLVRGLEDCGVENGPVGKRARLSYGYGQEGGEGFTSSLHTRGTSMAPSFVKEQAWKGEEGEKKRGEAAGGEEEEEDYGYFTTTEEDLDHFLVNILDGVTVTSTAGSVGSVGVAPV